MMLSLVLSLIGIFITVFFVIGTHEYAHFLTARLLGVKVLRFSIGFGKVLYRFTDKKQTEYVISLLPLGGYVKMLDENEEAVPPSDIKYAYNRQPFYKKFLIVLAGPFCNFLCAAILYWFIFMTGFFTLKPVIGSVQPQSIAAISGLQSGDEIIAIDGHQTVSWTTVLLHLLTHIGDNDQVTIMTKNAVQQTKTQTLSLTHWKMDELNPDPLSSLGIIPKTDTSEEMLRKIQYNPIAAFPRAVQEVADFCYFNLLLLGKMLTGKLSMHSLGGPITIFESAGNALNYGYLTFFSFLAFLSVSIGIINLLPVPGLDGGHLLFQLIEAVIRRPISERWMLLFYRLGFILILMVLVQAFLNDLLRLG